MSLFNEAAGLEYMRRVDSSAYVIVGDIMYCRPHGAFGRDKLRVPFLLSFSSLVGTYLMVERYDKLDAFRPKNKCQLLQKQTACVAIIVNEVERSSRAMSTL